MSYLIDTDIAIEHLGHNTHITRLLDRISGQPIYLSSITLAELYESAFWSSNPNEHIVAMQNALRTFEVILPNADIAIIFGELRAFLRRRGRMITDFDLLIGATALYRDLTLITFNKRHFNRIPDLRLYSAV
jgi:tRNA(fMet)-specific endonuclease VapC